MSPQRGIAQRSVTLARDCSEIAERSMRDRLEFGSFLHLHPQRSEVGGGAGRGWRWMPLSAGASDPLHTILVFCPLYISAHSRGASGPPTPNSELCTSFREFYNP